MIGSKDSKSKFRSDIDAEKAALDAARYADEHNLWKDGKAKVPAQEIVGYKAKTGEPTSTINVYRGEPNGHTGLSPIHASPGN